MSVLPTLRQGLVDVLRDAGLDLNLYTHVPGAIAVPAAFVAAGGPNYIEVIQGVNTFGEKTVRFNVCLVVEPGDNDSETSALDELIETAQAALEADGWLIDYVSVPENYAFANGVIGLVTAITVTSPVTFT